MVYPIHQKAYEIFEDIFTVQRLQCGKQLISEGDLGLTPRIIFYSRYLQN